MTQYEPRVPDTADELINRWNHPTSPPPPQPHTATPGQPKAQGIVIFWHEIEHLTPEELTHALIKRFGEIRGWNRP